MQVEQLEVPVAGMLSGDASLEIDSIAAFRDLVGGEILVSSAFAFD